MVISHDRWFLDRVATHILAFEGDAQVRWFEGTYEEYERWRKDTLGEDAGPKRLRYKPLVRQASPGARAGYSRRRPSPIEIDDIARGRSAGWCVWLVGGDGASVGVCEQGMPAVAAGADVVVVEQLVVAGAEQDEVVEFGLAAARDRDDVVGLHSRMAVQPGYWQCDGALVQRALLRVGRAAADA